MLIDLLTLLGVAMALLAGGFANGVIGFGMPLVSIPLVGLPCAGCQGDSIRL